MLNKASLEAKRNEKLTTLKYLSDSKVLSYSTKMDVECENRIKNEFNTSNDVSEQIKKANLREEYNLKKQAYKAKQDKKLLRQKCLLEKKDKRTLSRLNRVWEVDLLRGIIILGMVFDHLVYDFTSGGTFAEFFKLPDIHSLDWVRDAITFASGYWDGTFRLSFRVLGVVLLVFLCGVSSILSKNNFKRGGIILGAGIVVTIAINIFGKINNNSIFTVIMSTLTTLGLIIIIYNATRLLYQLVERKLYKRSKADNKKVSSWKWVALAISISIFAFWFMFRNAGLTEYNRYGITLLEPYNGPNPVINLNGFKTRTDISDEMKEFLNFFLTFDRGNKYFSFFFLFNNEGHFCLYEYKSFANMTFNDYVSYIFGAKGYGVDWLGLFPMLAYTFLGGFVGEMLYKDKKSILYFFFKKEYRNADDPLLTTPGKINAILNNATCFITYPGQKTLWVYVLHQPIMIILFGLIFLMCGATLILPF